MSYQFNRQISVIVTDASGNGLELSGNHVSNEGSDQPTPLIPGFHIIFQVSHFTTETPNSLTLRIYNLADTTAQQIQQEFTQIVVRAGYPGNFGIIFQGTIKHVDRTSSAGNINATRVGFESPADRYLDIFASDGDQPYNWGVMNTSLAAGYTPQDTATAIAKAMGLQVPDFKGSQNAGGFDADPLPETLVARPSPRGRVLYGMARDHATVLGQTNGLDWSIQGGTLQWLPYSAYKPGDAIVLTSGTGLIGFPQVTQDGIAVRCLLNPAINPGTRIQINNKSLQQLAFNTGVSAQNFGPSTSNDGFYKVIYLDHTGDTRGDPWYTDMVCLTIDSTQGGVGGAGLGTGVQDVPIPP